MEINNKYESPKPRYTSWSWSRQLLRFKELEIFVIYMFDYLELCHKRVWILPLSSNTKDVNIKKGKAVPLQAWSGPEGSRKLRFQNFMTTAQDGGKFVSLKHRPPSPPGNTPGTYFC